MTLVPFDNYLSPRRSNIGNALLSDIFGDVCAAPLKKEWAPAVDIKEDEEKYTVTADIPGVDLKDIEITMEKGALTIKGERTSEVDEQKDGYHRVERSYGSFTRRFAFPDNVDVDGIKAKGKDGVLTIVVPKQEAVKPKRITVS